MAPAKTSDRYPGRKLAQDSLASVYLPTRAKLLPPDISLITGTAYYAVLAALLEYLASIFEAWVELPATHKAGIVVYAWNLTFERWKQEEEVFEVSLSYLRNSRPAQAV